MLQLPDYSRPFTVLGIDPGTTTMGVSEIRWDLTGPRYLIHNAMTLKATDNTAGYRGLEDIHGNRFARLQQLRDALMEHLMVVRPHAVIAESSYKGRFVQSFAALTECVAMIRYAVCEYDPFLPMELVEPNVAKQAAGVDLKAMRQLKDKKGIVRDALANRRDLDWGVDLQVLDEHSVDAIAVGLHYYRALL